MEDWTTWFQESLLLEKVSKLFVKYQTDIPIHDILLEWEAAITLEHSYEKEWNRPMPSVGLHIADWGLGYDFLNLQSTFQKIKCAGESNGDNSTSALLSILYFQPSCGKPFDIPYLFDFNFPCYSLKNKIPIIPVW